MTNVKRVSPSEANELLTQGYVYVDVRSEPEFEESHPRGAVNVPLLHMGPSGMTPNPDFLDVMLKAFPKDAKLVLGCKAGRSALRVLTDDGGGSAGSRRAVSSSGPT